MDIRLERLKDSSQSRKRRAGCDLGTYHVRVTLKDGRGWIQRWDTHARFTHGSQSESPLNAARIEAIYDSEQDVLHNIAYMYVDGNYSCDCNKTLFLWRANAPSEPEPEVECGDTMEIAALVVIRPDGSEIDLSREFACERSSS